MGKLKTDWVQGEIIQPEDFNDVCTAVNESMPASGGTFTGSVKGPAPVQAEDLATRAYVDEAISSAAPPLDHAGAYAGYQHGLASGARVGHVYLSDATNSTLGAGSSAAATPAAVKSAYDHAQQALNTANNASKVPTNHASTGLTHGGGTAANYGHVKLSDAVDSTSAASASVAASPLAVRNAYNAAGKLTAANTWTNQNIFSGATPIRLTQGTEAGQQILFSADMNNGVRVGGYSTLYQSQFSVASQHGGISSKMELVHSNYIDSGPSKSYFYVGCTESVNGQYYTLRVSANHMLYAGRVGGTSIMGPAVDNLTSAGSANWRYSVVYANTGAISTSDKNQKKDFEPLDARYDALFDELKPLRYKFIDNESDRYHIGMLAQDVESTLENNNLTSADFAGFVKSPKTETIEDPETKEQKEIPIENEYRYGLRYEEFIGLLIDQVQKLSKRVAVLEAAADTQSK